MAHSLASLTRQRLPTYALPSVDSTVAKRALGNIDVFLEICHYLPFLSLYRLRQVDRRSRANVNYVLRYTWSLYLGRFVNNPTQLRMNMHMCRAMLSGSLPLSFFLRFCARIDIFDAKDMDMYCSYDTAAFMVDYLRQDEGYSILSTHPHPEDEYGSGIANVVKLVHRNSQATIDVICSARPTPETSVANFWGTHVIGGVSANAMAIAYPLWTLNGVGCVTHPGGSEIPRIDACISKYEDRGFEITEMQNSPFLHNGGNTAGRFYCPHRLRSFSDAGSLTITFDDLTYDTCHPSIQPAAFGAAWVFGGPTCPHCDQKEDARIMVIKEHVPY